MFQKRQPLSGSDRFKRFRERKKHAPDYEQWKMKRREHQQKARDTWKMYRENKELCPNYDEFVQKDQERRRQTAERVKKYRERKKLGESARKVVPKGTLSKTEDLETKVLIEKFMKRVRYHMKTNARKGIVTPLEDAIKFIVEKDKKKGTTIPDVNQLIKNCKRKGKSAGPEGMNIYMDVLVGLN